MKVTGLGARKAMSLLSVQDRKSPGLVEIGAILARNLLIDHPIDTAIAVALLYARSKPNPRFGFQSGRAAARSRREP
jgi:hypothetical protein